MRGSIWTAIAVGMLAIGALAGCAGLGSDPRAVQVGRQSISKDDVAHWASVIARGALVTGESNPEESARRQALALLIKSRWLTGEASRSGLRLSKQRLAQLVEQLKRTVASGSGEFQATLAESGETAADVNAEATARWAASVLAQRLAQTVERRARAEVTPAVVADFYRTHISEFHLAERRYYDLQEGIPTRARAAALAKRLGNGKRFGVGAQKESPFRPANFRNLPGQAEAYRAVFSARVGVLTGPIRLQRGWCLFVIRRIVPPRVQPLSEVSHSIEEKLLAGPRRRIRAQLVEEYRRRWIAQTDCRPGYVVQKCKQYRGPRKPEGEPFSGYS
jgi:parvulin-like peptidyl-prolyl cis-trans isomerase-like protein